MGRSWRPDWGDRFQGAWNQQLLDCQMHPIIFLYGFQKVEPSTHCYIDKCSWSFSWVMKKRKERKRVTIKQTHEVQLSGSINSSSANSVCCSTLSQKRICVLIIADTVVMHMIAWFHGNWWQIMEDAFHNTPGSSWLTLS